MDEGEEVTLLAVALAGEETYWLCQPIAGKRLQPEWKNCTCHWLYLVDGDIHSVIPWYTEDMGALLEVDISETSKIERFAVIYDSVKARKIVVNTGGSSRTFFIITNEERDIVEAKYDDLLKRERSLSAATPTTDPVSVRSHNKPREERRQAKLSSASERNGDSQVGNNEVFSWKNLYIVEYGNRIFYVCSAPHGNKYGFKVERLIRKGFTIYLLFQDEAAGPCKLGDSQKVDRVTASSVLKADEGKVMMMTTEAHGEVVSRERESIECSVFEPLPKCAKKEITKVDSPPPRSLRAIGVNLWIDAEEKIGASVKLADMFPFSSDGGSSVRTTVFPDGTCVTYDLSTAAKYVGKKKVVSAPTDHDMMGLLENIQLAKEQFNAL
ncbi:uncharacterized protein TM35_000173140 [Trypanosoma theileri]|uniref:Uncharacterized protein n=1 Tax=Trypanosoma theileri TaxID=67003 RepID=A0A1X0NUT7_9TRYP|nr:uncharacterized protein TM35_000173140 [Trypanosoma theileri]ORC88442.1 hypothetical protein TM35_000173140 [Trypanosoma theileri]